MTVDYLTALLKAASEAHHIHEKELGHADENWPQWYAAWIVQHASPSED